MSDGGLVTSAGPTGQATIEAVYQSNTYSSSVTVAALSWTAAGAAPSARRRHSVLVDTVNARMFALGGSIPPSDSVESTAIDGCGDLGTWETETALPMAVQGHAVAFYTGVHGEVIYTLGGHDGTDMSAAVQYASLDANGVDGHGWTTSANPLPEARHGAAAFV